MFLDVEEKRPSLVSTPHTVRRKQPSEQETAAAAAVSLSLGDRRASRASRSVVLVVRLGSPPFWRVGIAYHPRSGSSVRAPSPPPPSCVCGSPILAPAHTGGTAT